MKALLHMALQTAFIAQRLERTPLMSTPDPRSGGVRSPRQASSAVVTKQMSLKSLEHGTGTTSLRNARMRMQLQLVQATRDTRQLDEIVNAFTPPMRRVCPHLADAALREMIERMALQQLADEQRRLAAPRRSARRTRSTRGFGQLRAC
jgi:hypothetical protein